MRRKDDSTWGNSGYEWVIDPLDGTKNFRTGNPNWHITATRLKGSNSFFNCIISCIQLSLG
ncbi:MAG: inositol monophosphatase family protein [Patescibacteria group bacterium]